MSNEKEPLVSVIMSVYNTEEYLNKSISSVINQKYKNIEFIIINNGSTDCSLENIKFFIEKDSRIILINNEKNVLLSESRNQALDICNGKYVYIVDSDDYIESDTIDMCVKIAEKDDLDLVVFGWYMDYVVDNQRLSLPVCPKQNLFLNKEDFRKNSVFYLNQSILTVPWNKLYKRSVIESKHIRYRNTKLEDHHFNMDFISDIDKVAFIDLPLYHYFRSRSTSELNYIYKFNLFQKKKEHYLHTKEVFNYWGINDKGSWIILYSYFAERIVQCIQETVANEQYSKKQKLNLIDEILNDAEANYAIKKAKPEGVIMKIMVLPLKLHWKWLCFLEAKFINWYKKNNNVKFIRLRARNVNGSKEITNEGFNS